MRALLPLLAVLAAAPAPPAPPALVPTPPTSNTTALLVLRAACDHNDTSAFDEAQFLSYPPARSILSTHRVRLLSYEDTCGADWRVSVTRGALAALSGGGGVASAGCAGADVCGALRAAARALRRPWPAECGAGGARAAALAHLARRLRWRRALLPPAAPRPHCAAALREVSRALSLAGLVVRHADISPTELLHPPDVVMVCAWRGRGAHGAGQAVAGGAGGGGPAALLLHLHECELTTTINTHDNDASLLTNFSLVVEEPLTLTDKQNLLSERFAVGDTVSNVSTYFSQKSILPVEIVDHVKKNTNGTNFGHRVNGGSTKETRSNIEMHHHIESMLPPDELALFRQLLLLTDESLDMPHHTRREHLYDKLIQDLENESEAERARVQHTNIQFYLYERSADSVSGWRHAAVLDTSTTRRLDAADEPNVLVRLRNVSAALDSWSAPRPATIGIASPDFSAVALSAAIACASLALVTSATLLLRWLSVRRRRRRRRRDAVLSGSDFTFPLDEQRRVGEGMESMLSCWLQQLHSFGGPELERPDLLPRPPSAPSSTCSVNRAAPDRRIRYKGEVVHLKYLPATAGLELKRKATDVLLVMQNLRHENLNPFIGCVCSARPALVWEACGRGSLEDVLRADDIKLDWTFRLSLLTDLVRAMRYLHASPLRLHGRLSSRNCLVDSRWVLRVTDYGLPAFYHAQGLPHPHRTARDLLWTAPELLREARGEGRREGRATQAGDVFSFAIIMQEVIVRGEPYCMLALTPEEIVEKLMRPPPLIRPSVSMGAAPPDAVSVMRQCWSEAPDLRPDFHRLHDIFRHLHRGRKINIVDSMFEMLEKYSNNLEELIKERTEQLDMEKKKTEQLLNRMLPRSVAERLVLGSRVEPEEFSEVSIYFSDIVGFTALAARSTPVQVVDLLNDLYTTFDAAIEQYRVYKVETIGDAYMVVGGLPVRAADHAESVATMALHLLHLAGRFRLRHLPDTPLHLRIGLHSGPVCAAVVGLTMPRYCLFGDTVNTASRMESTGAAWRVQVSAETAARLAAAGGYRLRSRGLVQIKGKGAMHTYWLLGKDGFDKPLPTPPPLQSEEVLFEMEGENESEPSPTPPPSETVCAPSEAPAGPTAPAAPAPSSGAHDGPDRRGWRRSGAVSADCSPPHAAAHDGREARDERVRDLRDHRESREREPRTVLPVPSVDHSAQYSRYRCLGNTRRPLLRQWSLERGDGLAAAAASECGTGVASAPPSPPEPLALLAPAPPRAPAARYRTRPDRDAPALAPLADPALRPRAL